MFLKTKAQKKDTEYWITRGFRNFTGKDLDVIDHITNLANDVIKDIVIINADFEKMVKAVEFTIYERIKDVSMKAKAFDTLVARHGVYGIISLQLDDGTETTVKKVGIKILDDVLYTTLYLPDEYSQAIKDIISDEKPLRNEKFLNYMKTNKPKNYLEELFWLLGDLQFYLRDEVCKACGWSINTFFTRKDNRVALKNKRVLTDPFTLAEAEMIISIVKNTLLPSIVKICDEWESLLKASKTAKLSDIEGRSRGKFRF